MNLALQSVQRFKVWQRSVELVVLSYTLSGSFPSDERFGLIAQVRRAATSVPANIAEGFGRWNSREFAHFLAIASGSLRELQTHLIVATRLDYLPNASAQPALDAIDQFSKMLYRMRQRVLENARRSEQHPQPRRNAMASVV